MTMDGVEPVGMLEEPKEALMNADQVRKVVQREKAHAAEAARRDAQAQYEQELATLKQQAGSMGGQSGITDEMYAQMKERLMQEVQQQQEEQRRQQFEAQMQDVAKNYLEKMDKGRDLYEDFQKVTSTFEPEAFPKVVQLVSQMDNAADVIYELSRNPSKLVTINELANRSPKMAQSQLQSLVDSIKNNREALENNQRTQPPLSKIQPSTSAGSDSGAMSLRDYKKAPWLRG